MPAGATWADAARAAAADIKGLTLDTYVVGGSAAGRGGSLDPPSDVRDPSDQFPIAYGVGESGAVLVRPDGFVAWRAKAMTSDPARTMATVLRAILLR